MGRLDFPGIPTTLKLCFQVKRVSAGVNKMRRFNVLAQFRS
jgi:hypothetical protein